MGKPISKTVEAAVKAMQLFHGCGLRARLRDEQKLASRAKKAIERVVKQYAARGMTYDEAHRQIEGEARSRGSICPLPGRDI